MRHIPLLLLLLSPFLVMAQPYQTVRHYTEIADTTQRLIDRFSDTSALTTYKVPLATHVDNRDIATFSGGEVVYRVMMTQNARLRYSSYGPHTSGYYHPPFIVLSDSSTESAINTPSICSDYYCYHNYNFPFLLSGRTYYIVLEKLDTAAVSYALLEFYPATDFINLQVTDTIRKGQTVSASLTGFTNQVSLYHKAVENLTHYDALRATGPERRYLLKVDSAQDFLFHFNTRGRQVVITDSTNYTLLAGTNVLDQQESFIDVNLSQGTYIVNIEEIFPLNNDSNATLSIYDRFFFPSWCRRVSDTISPLRQYVGNHAGEKDSIFVYAPNSVRVGMMYDYLEQPGPEKIYALVAPYIYTRIHVQGYGVGQRMVALEYPCGATALPAVFFNAGGYAFTRPDFGYINNSPASGKLTGESYFDFIAPRGTNYLSVEQASSTSIHNTYSFKYVTTCVPADITGNSEGIQYFSLNGTGDSIPYPDNGCHPGYDCYDYFAYPNQIDTTIKSLLVDADNVYRCEMVNISSQAIWIDLNDDGDFDDASEKVLVNDVPAGGGSPPHHPFVLHASDTAVQRAFGKVVTVRYRAGAASFANVGACDSTYATVDFLARVADPTPARAQIARRPAFTLYPNPSAGQVWMRALQQPCQVCVYGADGRLVHKQALHTLDYEKLERHFAPGLYLVQAGGTSQRLVIE